MPTADGSDTGFPPRRRTSPPGARRSFAWLRRASARHAVSRRLRVRQVRCDARSASRRPESPARLRSGEPPQLATLTAGMRFPGLGLSDTSSPSLTLLAGVRGGPSHLDPGGWRVTVEVAVHELLGSRRHRSQLTTSGAAG